ncbi:hypothetical protein B0J14DRAFT_231592 [Halenospora varia]|nr:hypothetical protein B0J14DRAFT_231592 [Halenospora varia]
MAHQQHTLPWNVLERNFQYQPAYLHNDGQTSPDIIALQKPLQTEDLIFFSDALAKQIKDFGNFVRQRFKRRAQYGNIAAKWLTSDEYEAMPGASTTRKVIGERIMQKWTGKSQQERGLSKEEEFNNVENWIRAARRNESGELFYSGEEESMPEVVKVLLKEAAAIMEPESTNRPTGSEEPICNEALDSLLLMANHPKIPLMTLRYTGSHYEAGISTILRSCLRAYLMINLLVVLKEAGSLICEQVNWNRMAPPQNFALPKRYMECRSYQSMLLYCTCNFDLTGRRNIHGTFLNRGQSFHVLSDMGACEEYIKFLWRIMVVYDFVVREVGTDPDIAHETLCIFQSMFEIPYELDYHTNRIKLLCG